MAKNVLIVLNREGVREMLRSPEMGAICADLAEQIKGKYGKGAEVSSYVGTNRVNASVYQPAGTFDNKLLKSMGEVQNND